jgi:hypothetical protein
MLGGTDGGTLMEGWTKEKKNGEGGTRRRNHDAGRDGGKKVHVFTPVAFLPSIPSPL